MGPAIPAAYAPRKPRSAPIYGPGALRAQARLAEKIAAQPRLAPLGPDTEVSRQVLRAAARKVAKRQKGRA